MAEPSAMPKKSETVFLELAKSLIVNSPLKNYRAMHLTQLTPAGSRQADERGYFAHRDRDGAAVRHERNLSAVSRTTPLARRFPLPHLSVRQRLAHGTWSVALFGLPAASVGHGRDDF